MLDRLKQIGVLIGTVAELLRVLIPAVEVPGWGEDKKRLVLDVIGWFLDMVEEHFFKLPVEKDMLLKGAGFLLELYVAFFNKVGKFVHSVRALAIDSGGKKS